MRQWWCRAAAVTATVAAGLAGLGPAAPAGSATASASSDGRLAEMASPSPFRGLVYTGLSLGRSGTACAGAFEARSPTGASLGCSHGPDPAPPGRDVRRGRSDAEIAADAADGGAAEPGAAADGAAGASGAASAADAPLSGVGCIGDGVSGSRVQAIYAVSDGHADRSATVSPTIRSTYAPRVDRQFELSAAETGGDAHVVFVTEPDAAGTGCQLSVAVAHLSSTGDDSFSNTVSELKALGFNRADRKYLVWTDSNVLCGVGSLYSDSKAASSNLNNGYATMYARVDSGCWNYAEGHELMHTLGAVQKGAPHATAAGHCWDEPDEMCYDDGSGISMVQICPATRDGSLFDCNHDDYFYAGTPPLLNYLATHWNTWNSNWLLRAPLPALATTPSPPGTGSTGGATSTTTTTRPPTTSTTNPSGGTGSTSGVGVPPLPIGGILPAPIQSHGYWMLTADGHVHAFGGAAFLGQPAPLPSAVKAVDLEPTPSGQGYWVLDDSGRVRDYGDADVFGSVPAGLLGTGEKAVSLSATPTGRGYWVFTSRGRAVPFGDAGFFGDASGLTLNRPIIGSVATPSGLGYYLFASDGGIFTFGDADFFGSTGAFHLNRPVVGMAPTASGRGYQLVAADGGLFAFGDAGFYGSMGGVRLNRPVSAVVPGPAGYLMVGEDGGAFSFGDVDFFGSLADHPPTTPVVSVALQY
ncbi:MAG TPA: hypothetical protein VHL53_24135 [Acidimicrobiia bacterium]|nr:hypothetical protein [Acidimicrobiia bacterium]